MAETFPPEYHYLSEDLDISVQIFWKSDLISALSDILKQRISEW